MNIDELTIGQVKQLAAFLPAGEAVPGHPYKIGQAYLIRTVTCYYTGCLISVLPQELVLEKAAWIPDTGRFYDALKTGALKEVEPIPGLVIVGRGAVVDAIEWSTALPESQK